MSESADTDELLCRAQRGDPDATMQLLDRHRPRLTRMVSVRMDRSLVARFDPSDVVQETLIVASKRLPQYADQRPVEFYPWLRRLAYERLVELHRQHVERNKRSVRREQADDLALPDESADQLVDRLMDRGPRPSGELIREELRTRVRSTLDRLPKKYREVLVLRHLEQLTHDETASVLGIESATAKTRYYRAIQQMHNALSGTLDDM